MKKNKDKAFWNQGKAFLKEHKGSICFGLISIPFLTGAGIFAFTPDNYKELKNEIIEKVMVNEDFLAYKDDNLNALTIAHDHGIISDTEYKDKVDETNTYGYVLNYARNNEEYKDIMKEYESISKASAVKHGVTWGLFTAGLGFCGMAYSDLRLELDEKAYNKAYNLDYNGTSKEPPKNEELEENVNNYLGESKEL